MSKMKHVKWKFRKTNTSANVEVKIEDHTIPLVSKYLGSIIQDIEEI